MTTFVKFFGILGMVSSQCMNALAIPSIIKIHNAKSTLSFPSFPVVIALTSAIHNVLYAHISRNIFVTMSSSITFAFNTAFLGVHYRYSSNPGRIMKEFLTITILSLFVAIIGALYWPGWIGMLSTLISCSSYCGQLSTFSTVVRTRNASSISPWITAGVAFKALMWMTHSILVEDGYNFTSAFIGIVSALIQTVLLTTFSMRIKVS